MVDHLEICRTTVQPLVATEVDGQLRCLVELLGKRDGAQGSGDESDSLQRHQAAADCGSHRGENLVDPCPLVDGRRNERQILGQGQKPLRAQRVLDAEAFDRPQ